MFIQAILKAVIDCSAVQYVPELWSDAVYMELAEKEQILELILEALASGSVPDPTMETQKDDVNPVLATAKAITEHVDAAIKLADERDRTISLRHASSLFLCFIKKGLQ